MFFIVVKADSEVERYLAADKRFLYWTEYKDRMLTFETFEAAENLTQEVLGLEPDTPSGYVVYSSEMKEMALRLSLLRVQSKGRLQIREALSRDARYSESRLQYEFKHELNLAALFKL